MGMFIKSNIIISKKNLHQQKEMSNSIFSCCCNGLDKGDQAQSTQMSSFKKPKTDYKKNYKLGTPKASLKNLTSQRSSQNIFHLQDLKNQNNSKLIETPRIIRQTVQLQTPLPASFRLSQQYLSPNHNNVVFVSPFGRQLTPTASAVKDKIRFSYDLVKSAQNSHIFSSTPQRYRINTQPTKREETVKFIQNSSRKQQPIKLNQNKFQILKSRELPKIQENIKEFQVEKNPQQSSSTGIKLGNSMFTIQSQEQVQVLPEQKKQVRLEQSAIIVNVFNPTQSQMNQWQLNKKTNRMEKKSSKKV